jgi:RHS repeat-associated protein
VVLDGVGRPTSTSIPGLLPVTLTYDPLGKLTLLEQGERGWRYTYDTRGRLTTVRDTLQRVTGFSYNLADRESTQTLPGGRVVTLDHDANGNLTSLTPPGRPAHGFGYSAVDLNESYTPPPVPGIADPATRYEFNRDRQLTRVTRPDGGAIELSYGAATGQLASITQPRGANQLTYLPGKGQVATLSSPDSVTLSYEYTGPLLTQETWSGAVAGSVAHRYDRAFRDSIETVNGAWGVTYGYDGDGLVASVTPATGSALTVYRRPEPGGTADNGLVDSTQVGVVVESLDYNAHGELANLRYRRTTDNAVLLQQSLSRDALGRVTALTETVAGVTHTTGYTYDVAGRLESVSTEGVQSRRYEYDSLQVGNGNRTQEFGPGDQLLASASYDAQDRMLRYGIATYGYTAAGELARRTSAFDTLTTTYDAFGNLVAASKWNATTSEPPLSGITVHTVIGYAVDGQNRRVRKSENGTPVQGWLYRNGLNPVAELDGSNAVVNRFVYATQAHVPDLLLRADGTYRVVTDHLGSVRAVVDVATGVVVQRLDYDTWGNLTLDTAPAFQGLGYAGGLQDRNTKLVRFGARDYDASVGRWTARDPIGFAGQSANYFAYGHNAPIVFIDPSGLRPLSACEREVLREFLPKAWLESADIDEGGLPWFTAINPDVIATTVGNNIYMRPGVYKPNTPEGLALLGHELAHVGQYQSGMNVPMYLLASLLTLSYDDNIFELQAARTENWIRATLESRR